MYICLDHDQVVVLQYQAVIQKGQSGVRKSLGIPVPEAEKNINPSKTV